MGKLKDEAGDTYEEGRDGSRYDGDYWAGLLQTAEEDIQATRDADETRRLFYAAAAAAKYSPAWEEMKALGEHLGVLRPGEKEDEDAPF